MASSPGKRGRLSAHFAAHELACRHCGVCVIDPRLVALLERIRSRHQGPLRVIDGYRCPVHNLEVKGAADSQHMYGIAADIPPGILSPKDADNLDVGGAGIARDGWVVHVDVRNGPHARWHYT